MSSPWDLAEMRFGRWTVTNNVQSRKTPPYGSKVFWLCRCDCGAEKFVATNKLVSGQSQSCGCLNREKLRERRLTHGHTANYKESPEYSIWEAMRSRCTNPHNRVFNHYGGRGIKVCERWQKFENFIADLGPRPPDPPGWTLKRSKWSIERINNDGDYEPSNCKWATRSEQMKNRGHW